MFEPPTWGSYELDAIRIGAAFIALRTDWFDATTHGASRPVGLARLVDLAPLIRRRRLLDQILTASLLLYAAGWWLWASSGVAAIVAIVALTATSSDGVVNHGRFLTVIMLTATAAGTATWELARLFDVDLGRVVSSSAETTGVWWALQAFAAAYCVSGVAKLANTRFLWIWRSMGLTLHALARRETARAERASTDKGFARATAFVEVAQRHPALARAVFAAGLFVELFAPAALINRGTLFVGGVALIALHTVNGIVLGLRFRQFRWILALYLLQIPYLAVEAGHAVGFE